MPKSLANNPAKSVKYPTKIPAKSPAVGAKCGVYLRVSSSSQKVASQKREIERYLSGHNIEGARWFVDEGYSGKSLDRPAMQELQQAVFMGELDTVIVYALDRLAQHPPIGDGEKESR